MKRANSKQLRSGYADALMNAGQHMIFVTVQPNFGLTGNPRSGFHLTKLRRLLSDLFYDLDRRFSGCPRPQFLQSDQRFTGIAVIEGHGLNPHAHIILRCRNAIDQWFRFAFLLEMLATSENDDENTTGTWSIIEKLNGWRGKGLIQRRQSIIRQFASKGTVDVQLVRTHGQKQALFSYLTKEVGYSYFDMKERGELDFFEVNSFNSESSKTNPARRWEVDPVSGAHVLNLDKPITWRRKGSGIVR